MKSKTSHSKEVFKRWFRIWTITGENPFPKKVELTKIECPSCGTEFDTPYCPQCGEKRGYKKTKRSEFFKGSFDSIPFLNDDAKRTFVHLLFRPGYMMRDYLNGKTSRYLAPMTALIIFYAFFALVSGIITPFGHDVNKERAELSELKDSIITNLDSIKIYNNEGGVNEHLAEKTLHTATSTVTFFQMFHLDEHPELVDTQWKSSLASFESSLKSGGITLFLGNLIMITLALWYVTRKKYNISFSAAAAVTAYILCQFCFFMLFILFWTLGQKNEIGIILMAVLMVWDFIQLFGINRRKSLRLTIKIGLAICAEYAILAVFFGILIGLNILI